MGTNPGTEPARPWASLTVWGAGLFAACVGWTLVVWWLVGGDGSNTFGLLIGIGVAFVAGRAIGTRWPWAPAAAIVALGAGVVVAWGSSTWSAHSGNGPLGYTNARAAFFAIVAFGAAGLVSVLWRRSIPLATLMGIASLIAGSVPFAVRSLAASVLLCWGGLVILVGLVDARRRTAVTVAGCTVAVVLAGTLFAGLTYGPDAPAGDVLAEGLSTRRLLLWHESLRLIADHPITGVGPDGFRQASPTARRDVDASWAHHEFLQMGVETGLPGLIVVVALVGWGFVVLWSSAGPLAPTAAAALMSVAAHACVDYVAHFPIVPIAAAVLVGSGAGRRTRTFATAARGER